MEMNSFIILPFILFVATLLFIGILTIKKLQTKIKDLKMKNNLILSNLQEVVFEINNQLTISNVNERVYQLLGFQKQNLVGKNIDLILSTNDDYINLLNLIESQDLNEHKINCKSISQIEIPFKVKKIKITDQEVKKTLLIFIDGRTSEALEKMNENSMQIIQSSKLASLGEISGGIAHEINNPLSILKMNNRNIIKKINAGKINKEQILQKLTKQNETINRISNIVTSIRSFASSKKMTLKEVYRIDDIVKESLSFLKEKISYEGIDLILELNVQAIWDCNGSEITQVLINLISNAYDALYIDKSNNSRYIKIYTEMKTQTSFKLIIENNGPSIPNEIREKIMEPFFTTKPIGVGTGMGLSISIGLCKKNDIELYLDDSEITKFVLSFESKVNQKTA